MLGISIDRDGDGLCDAAEARLGTNPDLFDTDGDSVGDGAEVLAGTDPLAGEMASVVLVADPARGPNPFVCVLTATTTGFSRAEVTYTYDFGDGQSEVSGNPGALHVFERDGDHTVTVTVSDGNTSASYSVNVVVEPFPTNSLNIGTAGGEVSLGRCRVTVPGGVLDGEVPFTLTELPSMASGAAKVLNGDDFVPIGSAYRLDTPLKSAQPLVTTLTYDPNELPQGYSSSNLGVLVRNIGLPVIKDSAIASPGRPWNAVYMALPVSQSRKSSAVEFNRYEGSTFQLVAMRHPLASETLDSGKSGLMPLIVIVFNETPPNQSEYRAAVVESINKTYQELVAGRGFPGPTGTLTIVVGKMQKETYDGYVLNDDHHTMYLRSTLSPVGKVKKVIPHEFLHLVQNLCNNATSTYRYHDLNAWFKEGTAEWACDEVYDDFPGYYNAPWWNRFYRPVNEEGYDGSLEYQTVGFWKWVESQRPGTILSTLLNQQLRTHTMQADGRWVENANQYTFQDTFTEVWPDMPFGDFVTAIKYRKDFEADEVNTDDLWSGEKLGAPYEVDYDAGGLIELSEGHGDSEDNAVTVEYTLEQYMSLDTKVLQSAELSGVLHLRFLQTSEPLNARVLLESSGLGTANPYTLDDLSTGDRELNLPFKEGAKVIVLPFDARHDVDSGDNFNEGRFKAWIESPCSGTTGTVTEVSTAAELVEATESVGAGNTIRIAAGTYVLPADRPSPAGYKASLVIDGLTLIGAGQGVTNLDIKYFYVSGKSVRLQNMTIRSDSSEAFDIRAVNQFSMCNVTVVGTDWLLYGVTYRPPLGPGNTGQYSMTLKDCTITTRPDPFGVGTTGVKIYGCDISDDNCRIEGKPVQYDAVNLSIINTSIQGFKYGVQGHFYPVEIDCTKISGPWGRVISTLPGSSGEHCH